MPIVSSFLTAIYLAVVLVLLFGLTIFIHELGHFLVALKFGMVVDVFSIGFGPAIWKKKIRGVMVKICWIPLGGYVALPQLDPSGMATVQGTDEKTGKTATNIPSVDIPPISPWKKIVVSLAGATGNIILAFIFAFVIYLSPDVDPPEANTLVGYISTNSVAYAEGLRVGDEILAINDEKVETWTEITVNCTLLASTTTNVTITVESGGETRALSVPTDANAYGNRSLSGMVPSFYCIVTNVAPDSPAAQAGLQPQDMITRFNNIRIASVGHLLSLVADAPDGTMPIVVNRKGDPVPLDITLSAENHDSASPLYALIHEVSKDTPAEAGGLKAGDVIQAIDDIPVMSAAHLRDLVAKRGGEQIRVTLDRRDGPVTVSVIPEFNEKLGRAVMGILPTDYLTAVDRLGLRLVEADAGVPQWMIYKKPLAQIKGDFRWIFRTLRGFVSKRPGEAKQVAKGIAGPARILVLLWFSIQAGLLNAIGFIRFLNINLAVLNLLPIPVLDGGHIVFCLIEGITRRKLHPKLVNTLINAFAILLIGAVILVTFFDFKGLPNFFRQLRGQPPAEAEADPDKDE